MVGPKRGFGNAECPLLTEFIKTVPKKKIDTILYYTEAGLPWRKQKQPIYHRLKPPDAANRFEQKLYFFYTFLYCNIFIEIALTTSIFREITNS
jgi:hypothetical protein